MQISLAKMGIAVVVEDEQILGAVTDGDIRRAMQRNQEQFFALTVEDIMSRTPKTILETAKLSHAQAQHTFAGGSQQRRQTRRSNRHIQLYIIT